MITAAIAAAADSKGVEVRGIRFGAVPDADVVYRRWIVRGLVHRAVANSTMLTIQQGNEGTRAVCERWEYGEQRRSQRAGRKTN